jgi:hypothetical protein
MVNADRIFGHRLDLAGGGAAETRLGPSALVCFYDATLPLSTRTEFSSSVYAYRQMLYYRSSMQIALPGT